MRAWIAASIVALLIACGEQGQPRTAGAAEPAGRVELADGEVRIHDAARKIRAAAAGTAVFEGDRIETGSDGELHVAMEDGGFLAVRPNTSLTIAGYRAQGDERDQSVFSLLKGSIRSVTGWIARFNPPGYQVRTPTATIGVRGTDHEPLVIPEGSAEGEPGTYDKVNAGRSVLKTARGEIEVLPDRAAFAAFKGDLAPRLLAEIPRAFRSTRFEKRIEGKHREIQPLLDRKREDRRKSIEQRRGEAAKAPAQRRTDPAARDSRRAERVRDPAAAPGAPDRQREPGERRRKLKEETSWQRLDPQRSAGDRDRPGARDDDRERERPRTDGDDRVRDRSRSGDDDDGERRVRGRSGKERDAAARPDRAERPTRNAAPGKRAERR
jgi:hypothetical protein